MSWLGLGDYTQQARSQWTKKKSEQTDLQKNLGTHCREWPAEKANVQMLVEASSKPHDIVVFMDGSSHKETAWSGIQSSRMVVHTVTTSSLTKEEEAVTRNTVASLTR